MVFVTGDIHGVSGVSRLHDQKLRAIAGFEQRNEQHYIIVCGDFGLIWYNEGTPERVQEDNALAWLAKQNHITLFVDGNHENFERLNTYPIVDFMGGKAHKINEKVYHLMRGYVFDIQGNRIFVMGGAVSIDKHLRTEHVSWWSEEVPSAVEYDTAVGNLAAVNNEVDYVLTHCTNTENTQKLSKYFTADIATEALQRLLADVKYKHWYSGHYHLDKDCDNYTCLYHEVIPLGATVSGKTGTKMEKKRDIQVGDTVRLIEKMQGRWFEGKLTKFVGKKAHVQLSNGLYVELDKKLWCVATEDNPDDDEEQGTEYVEITENAVHSEDEQGKAEEIPVTEEEQPSEESVTEIIEEQPSEESATEITEEQLAEESADVIPKAEEPVIVAKRQMGKSSSPLANF